MPDTAITPAITSEVELLDPMGELHEDDDGGLTSSGSDDLELADTRALELSGEVVLDGDAGETRRKGLVQAAERLTQLLERTERALVLTDRVLRISQPPIRGKIGIRWWRRSGKEADRFPVLVTWQKARNGRWRAKPLRKVRDDRISRVGSSGLCADNTYRLAATAAKLIRYHATLRRHLTATLVKLRRAGAQYRTVDAAESAIVAEHRRVVAKLQGAGYTVDDKTLHLPDRYLS